MYHLEAAESQWRHEIVFAAGYAIGWRFWPAIDRVGRQDRYLKLTLKLGLQKIVSIPESRMRSVVFAHSKGTNPSSTVSGWSAVGQVWFIIGVGGRIRTSKNGNVIFEI